MPSNFLLTKTPAWKSVAAPMHNFYTRVFSISDSEIYLVIWVVLLAKSGEVKVSIAIEVTNWFEDGNRRMEL